jgi:hypothetical protein
MTRRRPDGARFGNGDGGRVRNMQELAELRSGAGTGLAADSVRTLSARRRGVRGRQGRGPLGASGLSAALDKVIGSDKFALSGTQVKMYSPRRRPCLSLDMSVLELFSAGKRVVVAFCDVPFLSIKKFDRYLVSCRFKTELL